MGRCFAFWKVSMTLALKMGLWKGAVKGYSMVCGMAMKTECRKGRVRDAAKEHPKDGMTEHLTGGLKGDPKVELKDKVKENGKVLLLVLSSEMRMDPLMAVATGYLALLSQSGWKFL